MSVKELVCAGLRDQELGPLRLLPWCGSASESTGIFSLVVLLHLWPLFQPLRLLSVFFSSFFFINRLLSILLISSPLDVAYL